MSQKPVLHRVMALGSVGLGSCIQGSMHLLITLPSLFTQILHCATVFFSKLHVYTCIFISE